MDGEASVCEGMTNTTATAATEISLGRKLVAYALVTLAAAGITLGLTAQPSDARGMLNPCQYDNTCTTTTVRR